MPREAAPRQTRSPIGASPRSSPGRGRLLVVSNRLPVRMTRSDDGEWRARPSAGGLVTALAPVLRRRGGAWVGWDGADAGDAPVDAAAWTRAGAGFDLHPVSLSDEERRAYYLRVSNAAVWPVLHGLEPHGDPPPGDWATYRAVSRRFARHVPLDDPRDLIWVHDYQLIPLGEELRRRGARHRVGFFLHTPFPDPDDFWKVAYPEALLRALLAYHLVGFQTERDLANFRAAVEAASSDVRPAWLDRDHPGRAPRLGHFPISVDADEWAEAALGVEPRVAEIRRSVGLDGILLLGVDRLDHSKGLPQKLEGFRRALRRSEVMRERATLLQLVVPSREGLPSYRRLHRRIEALVGEIREEFAHLGRDPLRYVYGEWDRPELVAHYRAADVLVVNSLRDGMNLVAKEYCMARVWEPGTLVLSRRAGATAELGFGAVPVDPVDPDDVAAALVRAARMPRDEARRRMGRMRRWIARHDVDRWAASYLTALADAVRGVPAAGGPPRHPVPIPPPRRGPGSRSRSRAGSG